MILVTMGNNKSLYFVNILFQIGNIRDYQVDSKHIICRKCQSAVHNNDAVLVFKSSDIHTNLLHSS